MTQSDIRVMALDLDGTLENSAHEVTPRTEAAIRAAMAQGVRVIIATGKTHYAGRKVRERLALDTPSVHSQGLMVYAGDGSILYEDWLDSALVVEVTKTASKYGAEVVANSQGRTLATVRNAQTLVLEPYGEPPLTLVDSLEAEPIQKMIAVAEPEQIVRLREQFAVQLAGRATLVQSNLDYMLEILPLGASKGGGVRRALEYLGLRADQMLAIGDGENDVEMIEMAAIGVAMGNAGKVLKNSADFITTTNDEDGVALAIEKFVLNSERNNEAYRL